MEVDHCGVLKNGWFERFARKERLADSAVREAVQRAEGGLIDADLGSGVIKQRVAPVEIEDEHED